ncbi:MAG TPA: AMP-binding protein [Thermoanaerobaculia bacterium]|nr:AMP-binding protein [Thermoanaerobaculia bacterium]
MNLGDLFAIPCRRTPEKVALRCASGEITYAALFAAARGLAAGLQARGLGPGDRLAFFLGNGPELVTAHLAALLLGAVMVPIHLASRRREIAHLLADAGPRLLLTESAQLAVWEELAPAERAGVEEVVLAEDLAGWAGNPSVFLAPRVEGGDPALILYTSGTTGPSKGAMLSHDNLLATVTGLLAAWAWSPEDTLLLTLPLFHLHGLVVGLDCALAAGATVELWRRFDAGRALDRMARGTADAAGRSGITLFFGVPTLYVRLLAELARRQPPADLRAMRLFCSGSAPLAAETWEAFRELTGHEILERYGMTEAGMILSNLYAGPRLPGTVGHPLPGVSVRVVDEAGGALPPGSPGELLVRGANVFSGYWRAPQKTAASFRADELGRSWFATGDLARQDPATGAYTLLGRRHELILCGGENVYPREVEEALAAFPGVREAAVVGRPHPEWGEVPHAFLVVEEGEAIDEAALAAFLRGQLAAFKLPRSFARVDALPRNALGKLQKHLLPAS